MNHWAFVTSAYLITLGATVAMSLWAWASMRAAEKAAER